jgi:hypothetical protein
MFYNIIIILMIFVLVFYYSTRLKEGFASQFPAQFNALNTDAAKKYNEVSNTLNLINPVIPLTSAGSNTVKAALNTVDMIPTSGSYNVKAPRPTYDIPNTIPSTLATAKKCEEAPASCSAFDDTTFAENCGMSFDIEGTNSDGKVSTGGLYVSPDSRNEQLSNAMKARELHQDPYQVFQPTVGTAKPGKFALTKDDCVIVKERVDCESKQNFDSPNCTQCYTSRTFSRVGPEVSRIPFKIILTGKGSCNIVSNNSEITTIIKEMQDARKHYGGFTFDDKNKSFEFEFPGHLEGTEFYIISSGMHEWNTGILNKASISGLIRGNTAKGSFSMDISHMIQVDRATGVKPRISGTIKLDGFNVVRMVPGRGKDMLFLACLIPFSFMDTNDYETGSCDNGPVITQANSAIFLNSDACFNKKNKPGDYNLECLQSRWISMGGTPDGTGYPSTKEKADALQKNSDGSVRTLEAIIDTLTVIMLQAQTGRNANGQQLSMEDWNTVSMFATGKTISSPCDVDDTTTGPLSKECLYYLYMNQGTTSHIGPTYDLPTWTTANLVGQPVRQTYCQPGAGMDPNTEAGLKLGQGLGGVEEVKAYYNRINRIANDNSLSNSERENEIKQCYNVSLNPVVDNATPGPSQVFAVGPGYDYTRDQAAGICSGYGAKVATKAQLAEAQKNGADWCFSGWVQDSPNGQWPITTSVIGGCGGRQGIIEWTPESNKAGVNCYGPKPAIQSVSQGTIKPFNGTNWDQPSQPGYAEVPTGYLQTTGEQPACFSGLTPEQAKEGCDRLGNRCAGISYSKDGLGHGCYKGNQQGGLIPDAGYMGFVKTPIPVPPPAPAANQPYKTGSWRQIPGSLKQVSHDGNVVCGVNRYDDIYCKDTLDQANWFQVPGKLKHVSVSNGKLYGANSNDDIFYNDNFRSGNWRHIPGKLKEVDIDGNTVCGVNSADNIYCKDNLEHSNWFQVPGGLKHVAVSNGKLYGVNSGDAIWYNDNFRSGNWRQIPGGLKQVDIDGNVVCGVNSADDIFCKDNLEGGNWFHIPGKLKYVSVNKDKLYGVNSGDAIYAKI